MRRRRAGACRKPGSNARRRRSPEKSAMRWFAVSLFLAPLAAEPVTFNKHIAPLVFQYCSPCHRPGEAAPFSLLTYTDARKHASQIVAVTERRYMPPWLPETGYGNFAGERRLTAQQLQPI